MAKINVTIEKANDTVMVAQASAAETNVLGLFEEILENAGTFEKEKPLNTFTTWLNGMAPAKLILAAKGPVMQAVFNMYTEALQADCDTYEDYREKGLSKRTIKTLEKMEWIGRVDEYTE